MANFAYDPGQRKLMEALQEAVHQAQLERVMANKTSDVELALHPDDVGTMLKMFGAPDRVVAHEGNGASYEGIPIRESALTPPGQAFVVDRGAQIRGVTATSVHVDEVAEFNDAMRDLGSAAADTTEAVEYLGAMLNVSGRMLPPPEWQDRAVRAAQAAGMDLEWCQQVRVRVGQTDTWARVTTGRGGFDVRPGDGESWTQALAAVGVDVPLA